MPLIVGGWLEKFFSSWVISCCFELNVLHVFCSMFTILCYSLQQHVECVSSELLFCHHLSILLSEYGANFLSKLYSSEDRANSLFSL